VKQPEKPNNSRYSRRPSKNININNINNLVLYNIKLNPDPAESKSDKSLSPISYLKKNVDNNLYKINQKSDKLIQSTLQTDENFYEALKFIKTIPNVEFFDRPKRSIPKRN